MILRLIDATISVLFTFGARVHPGPCNLSIRIASIRITYQRSTVIPRDGIVFTVLPVLKGYETKSIVTPDVKLY